jgi:hypothetical protein
MSDLMESIREDIEKEHHAIQNSDIVVFFQVAQFVTSFQYHKYITSKVRYEVLVSIIVSLIDILYSLMASISIEVYLCS